jgi:hypothetical protein
MYNLEVAQDHTFTVGVGQWVVHNCANPAGLPGTLQDLVNKGYNLSQHFIDQWTGPELRGKGLTAGDITHVLQTGSAYLRDGDTFATVTGKTLGRNSRTLSIVFNQFKENELHSIFERGFPDMFEYIDNPFDPFKP